MYHFTIKDIENLCGIKAHTLRIWERRFNLLVPQRKASQHRVYDNEDLKKLLRLSVLYHRGYKISHLAQLSHEHVMQALMQTPVAPTDYHFYISQLIEKALAFDKAGFEAVLNQVIAELGFETAIIKVCFVVLQKIGLLWMTDKLIPAQEHFCLYIIQHKVIAETDKLPAAAQAAPEIVLVAPHGELHELPLHFIHYLLRKNGWTTLYLGTNVKQAVLQQVAAQPGVTHIFLHVVTNFTGFLLDDYFETLCRLFPEKTIVASGAAVFTIQRQFTNLLLLKSDQAIENFVAKRPLYFGVT